MDEQKALRVMHELVENGQLTDPDSARGKLLQVAAHLFRNKGYERTTVREGNNTGGAILGAIAGGLLGSTVGKGNGKVAAAAVGAATGAVVGDRWKDGDRRYESRPRQVERCQVHDNYRQIVSGYDVRYTYEGREYSTRLPYDPGKWLALNVSFTVADTQGGWKNSRNDWNY